MDVSYQLSRIHAINSIVSCILLESWSIKKSGVVGLVGGECGGGVTYFHEQRPAQRSPAAAAPPRRRPATAPRPRRSQGRREANHSSSAEFQASETHAYQSESGTRPQ